MAVLLPLLWLMVTRLHWTAAYIAYGVAVCTMGMVGICWYLRWRGMQHTLARARILAEVARSTLATQRWGTTITQESLACAPALEPLARVMTTMARPAEEAELASLKEDYLENRLKDQESHYRKKGLEALKSRRRLSRIVTRGLDGALFLAVGGLIVGLSSRTEMWLQLSGLDLVLGFIGSALPLIAILAQSMNAYLELNRRTGRYAQQIDYLQAAQDRLNQAPTLLQALELVREVERSLLAEVVEWFYQTEHAEMFYRPQGTAESVTHSLILPVVPKRDWIGRLLGAAGISAGFVGRLVFGRVLVASVSAVLTIGLVSYHFPESELQRSLLRLADGRLLSDAQGTEWHTPPEETRNGFVLIAHGLHDTALLQPSQAGRKSIVPEPHWMSALQSAIREKLKSARPNICLVDWGNAAEPSKYAPDGFTPFSAGNPNAPMPAAISAWVQDIGRIRPQGQQIGDLVGFKLARAIHRGELDRTKPMHFIGHSAGGFVITRAAIILHELGLAPERLRLTLLDTPLPEMGDLKVLLETCDIDFYRTSLYAQELPTDGFHRRFRLFDLREAIPPGTDPFNGAHSFAHDWFVRSVSNPGSGGEGGFQLSPFKPTH